MQKGAVKIGKKWGKKKIKLNRRGVFIAKRKPSKQGKLATSMSKKKRNIGYVQQYD